MSTYTDETLETPDRETESFDNHSARPDRGRGVATDGGVDETEEGDNGVLVTDELVEEYLDAFAEGHADVTVQQRDHVVRDFLDWCRSEEESR